MAELCKSCAHQKVCMKDKNLVGDVFVPGNPRLFDNAKLFAQYEERKKAGFPCDDYLPADVGITEDGIYIIKNGETYKITPKIEIPFAKRVNIMTGEIYYPSNADRIRGMSDEELARFIGAIQVDVANYCGGVITTQLYPYPDENDNEWVLWLKSPVEVDDG